MATQLHVSAPSVFQTNSNISNVGSFWTKWKKGFNNYLTASGVTDSEQKKALLLHCGSEDLRDIFETLAITPHTGNDATGTAYDNASTALNAHFTPKQKKRYERHIFRNCHQQDRESMGQYVIRLRTLAKTCESHDPEDEIVDQIIEKCTSSKLRKSLLKTTPLTLTKILEIAQLAETISHQTKHYDDPTTNSQRHRSDTDEEINCISHNHSDRKSKINLPYKKKLHLCYCCGNNTHLAHQCEVAKDKKCHSCGKVGHLSNIIEHSRKCKVRTLIPSGIYLRTLQMTNLFCTSTMLHQYLMTTSNN